MVALKLQTMWGAGGTVFDLKQERRGGIETGDLGRELDHIGPRSRNAVVALKRKQREVDQVEHQGSRNAVVALKHELRTEKTSASTSKQERRGGIETIGGSRILRGGRSWKQERRGGIETRDRVAEQALGDRQEAGTPWWH